MVHDKDVNHLEAHTHSILKQGHGACLAGVSFYPTDVVCIHMHQIQNNLSIIIKALRGPLPGGGVTAFTANHLKQTKCKTQTSDLAHQDDDITTISQRVLDIKSFITGQAARAQP